MYGHDHGHDYGHGCSGRSRLKRGLLIGLFSIGAIGGFASGIHSMKHHCQARREKFENHVADVCVKAANRAEAEAAAKAEATKNAAPPPATEKADK